MADTGVGAILNDVHSALNPTRVARVVRPDSTEDVIAAVRLAATEGRAVSVAGSRHSMGGQQFAADGVHLDMRGMTAINSLDADHGIVDVEAGIEWHELIDGLQAMQTGRPEAWGIRQKQTGSDGLSLGGALSSDVHGRGLVQRPIVEDVDGFTLVDAEGQIRIVDRASDPERFGLVIGGYGLFGVITSVRLRLAPRRILRREVAIVAVDELMPAFEARIKVGSVFGDFQFSIDERSPDFLRQGILSCYTPEPAASSIPDGQRALSTDDWKKLLYLTHVDRAAAAQAYIAHYSATSGQLYWSDLHQRSEYVGAYHAYLDVAIGAAIPGTEIITEIYVPRPALAAFMVRASDALRGGDPPVVYGTIRLVERDDEAVLAWAREPWACIIFNLHTNTDATGLMNVADTFRKLIDLAIDHGGSYYLTYHRFATREQLETCHPRFQEFLESKRRLDPSERFQSDWYRHHREMFGLKALSPPPAARPVAG
ncbi:MAG TPA: FAD-binding oxidoreductase [Candidatus Limnocylindrales bacterium]|nr:FAD-binding oxidoreductase [Candidatus Limnocylindrales bacterium]